MIFINKAKKKYIAAFCYIMSLLPIFLPWCYFDKEIDGIKYGTDIFCLENGVMRSIPYTTINFQIGLSDLIFMI